MHRLRDARLEDLPEILDIHNDVVARTTAVFSDAPFTLGDRRAWFDGRQGQGYPVLVAEDAGRVVGFASFGDFRAWPGYRHTVEHSVHVAEAARGASIGTHLVTELVSRAQALGKHVLVAGIDAANLGSIRMHERLGFARAGTLREVGWKFGRWLDLTFLQRML